MTSKFSSLEQLVEFWTKLSTKRSQVTGIQTFFKWCFKCHHPSPTVCLFVCLWVFVPLENFSLVLRRHHCRWRAANFDLCSALIAIEQWGSLACHTYCDTGHPFIMVISEDPWHNYCRTFSSETVTICFYDLGVSRLGFEHPTFHLQSKRSSPLRHRRGSPPVKPKGTGKRED